ncbi:unknown [Clostridium sp. CAG:715]|nr:unknown [Clostridium sp. CAG:715]
MLQTKANNKFGTLTKRTKKVEDKEFNIEDYNYLTQKDKRMRFNTSKDPIYYVFDVIENRPISTLAKEFVKDSFFEAVNFVSQVVR